RAEAHVVRARVAGDVLADEAQVGGRLGNVLAHARTRLEHALHQLRLEPAGHLGLGRLGQQLLDAGYEVEPARLQKHVLLLDPDRQRWTGAEAVVQHARASGP